MKILQMNFIGSVLILILIFLRKFLLNSMSKRSIVALWRIICIGFFVPYSFYQIESVSRKSTNSFAFYPLKNVLQKSITSSYVYMEQNSRLYLYIWIIGIVLLSLFFFLMYVKGYHKFQNSKLVSDKRIIMSAANLKSVRTITIKHSDSIRSPLTYGLIKPVILLPTFLLDEADLNWDYILIHEYIHIIKGDLITKLLAVITLCVYWFNPLVWVMFFLINNDIEMACDEDVLKKTGVNNRKKYAEVLVFLAEKNCKYYVVSNSLCNSNLKERVLKIVNYHEKRILNSIILLIVVPVVIFFSAFSLKKSEQFFNEMLLVIPAKEDIINLGYPTNQLGETYGPDIKDWNSSPDLVLVENKYGKTGYIRIKELETDVKKNPENMHKENYKIGELNMYLHDGKTIIGKFDI